MTAPLDLVTCLCALSFIVLGIYALALWIYALVRTGFGFFWLLVIASVLGVIVSIINAALVYDHYVGIRLLGQPGWKIFYYAFYCVQPVESLLSVVGSTILVIWITRRSNQPLQPTADRRDDQM